MDNAVAQIERYGYPIHYRLPGIKPCACGCGQTIAIGRDDHILIDDMIFSEDSCVTNYYINEAGGRRIYA